jgi:hypothetical protein
MLRTAAGLIALSLLTAAPARSQVLIGALLGGLLSTPTFNIGFDLGLNFARLNGMDGADRATGPQIGLFGSWLFSEHYHLWFALEPLSTKGASDATPVPLGDPTLDPLIANGQLDRTLNYLDIPVLFQFAPHRDAGFRFGAGGQLAVLLGANDRYDGVTPQGTAVVIERDIKDAVQPVDAGVAASIEYRIPKLSFAIAVRYYWGLTTLFRDGDAPSIHQRVLTGTGRITLGVKKPAPDSASLGAKVRLRGE